MHTEMYIEFCLKCNTKKFIKYSKIYNEGSWYPRVIYPFECINDKLYFAVMIFRLNSFHRLFA